MGGPLALLCVLSIIGGWFVLPLFNVFPASDGHHPGAVIEWISISVPLVGVLLAYLIYLGGQLSVTGLVESPLGQLLKRFWYSGWGMDWLYDRLFVRPFVKTSEVVENEPVDAVYDGLVHTSRGLHGWLSRLQTGQLRWYAASMVFGLIVLIMILVRV